MTLISLSGLYKSTMKHVVKIKEENERKTSHLAHFDFDQRINYNLIKQLE